VIFQDFPGPENLKKKIQDFPGGMGREPCMYRFIKIIPKIYNKLLNQEISLTTENKRCNKTQL